jgi:hypothetical protein
MTTDDAEPAKSRNVTAARVPAGLVIQVMTVILIATVLTAIGGPIGGGIAILVGGLWIGLPALYAFAIGQLLYAIFATPDATLGAVGAISIALVLPAESVVTQLRARSKGESQSAVTPEPAQESMSGSRPERGADSEKSTGSGVKSSSGMGGLRGIWSIIIPLVMVFLGAAAVVAVITVSLPPWRSAVALVSLFAGSAYLLHRYERLRLGLLETEETISLEDPHE